MASSFPQAVRTAHKWGAIVISVPIIAVIITGIFLQVRKPVDWIQPPLQEGVASYQPSASLDAVLESVKAVPSMKVGGWDDIKLLDLRPEAGIIKVRNHDEFEVQLDAKTAEVLFIGQRLNDIIKRMHEGTTWGIRLWVFLPIGVIWLCVILIGSYLLITKTQAKLRARKRKRAAAAKAAPADGQTVTSGSKRPFNIMAFTHEYHYWLALIIVVPWLIVIGSGLLLQVRYEVPWVMPVMQKGQGTVPTLAFEEALAKARAIPDVGVSEWKNVWRLYVYPARGLIQIRAKNLQEIQLDAATGDVLQVAVRRTNLIEDIHEGRWMGANFWLFLPIHALSVILWMLGVTLWTYPLFASDRRIVSDRRKMLDRRVSEEPRELPIRRTSSKRRTFTE